MGCGVQIMSLKLTVDMIPSTSVHINIRNHLTPHQWNKLSKHIAEKSNQTCEICKRVKGEGFTRLHCHEVWDFDFDTATQTLIKLQPLCFECHCVKHMGFSYGEFLIDESQIIDHFLKVNNVDLDGYLQHFKKAAEVYKQRSEVNWEFDFTNVLEMYKEVILTQHEKKIILYKQVYELLKNNRSLTNKDIIAEIGSTYGLNRVIKDVRKDRELERIRKIYE